VNQDEILARVGRYYADRFQQGGCTAAGVDWKSRESQEDRFAKLLEVTSAATGFSLNDYGCGYGGLADYLHEKGVSCSYRGFDVAEGMIEDAARRHAAGCGCRFVTERRSLVPAEYTVASGIFNVMAGVPAERWAAQVRDTILDLATVSIKGFAFNVLSSHVAMDRRRPHLYYADPVDLWRFCVSQVSPQAALLHDYWPHEFTMIVRLPNG
jgi:hypothetical protein